MNSFSPFYHASVCGSLANASLCATARAEAQAAAEAKESKEAPSPPQPAPRAAPWRAVAALLGFVGAAKA